MSVTGLLFVVGLVYLIAIIAVGVVLWRSRAHVAPRRDAIVQKPIVASDCACVPDRQCSIWFGPCEDGLNHRDGCPVAKRAMTAAKWPCGRPRYPDIAAGGQP